MMRKLMDYLSKFKVLSILYTIAAVLFVISLFMVLSDKYYLGYKRDLQDYQVISEYDTKTYLDATAPQKVRKECRFRLDRVKGDAIIGFYNLHNYAEVFIGGEKVYEYKPRVDMKLGKTLGPNFPLIPLDHSDEGKKVVVRLQPIYDNVIETHTEFLVGPEASIFRDIFYKDFPIFILSILSIIVGIILVLISIGYKAKMRLIEVYPLYLGFFAILFGQWRAFDLELSAILFPLNTKFIFYLSFGSVALLPAAFSMYLKELMKRYNCYTVRYLTLLICLGSISLFLVQIFGISDLRDNLYFIFLLALLSIILIIYINIYLIVNKQNSNKRILVLTLIFSLSGLIDIIAFLYGHMEFINISFLLFLIYALLMGTTSISENGRKAYIDIFTGLFNKSYCMELLEQQTSASKAVIMMDLNYLKQTNDLYGHEEGDRLIEDFASCIVGENTNHVSVGRFGGDEFIIIINNLTKVDVESICKRIKTRVNLKNTKRDKIKISYAIGYAITDNQMMSYHELLEVADQSMYENKRDIKLKESLA